jgi:hypothetical protein
VNGNDGAGPRAGEAGHGFGIDRERLGDDVREHGTRTAHRERVRRRHEGERWYDDLVARADVEKRRRQLEGVCTRRREQPARHTEGLFQKLLACGRERPVARYPAVAQSPADILCLRARGRRAIEGNGGTRHATNLGSDA